MYAFEEVDGELAAEVLRSLNTLDPAFLPLTDLHLETGWWWLLKGNAGVLVGFAGMVPMEPFPGVGYLKRGYVSPDHRGRGLQLKMIQAREAKAREIGWHLLVSETKSAFSAHNLCRAGFEACEPEQTWGEPGSQYFVKRLK